MFRYMDEAEPILKKLENLKKKLKKQDSIDTVTDAIEMIEFLAAVCDSHYDEGTNEWH